MMQFFTIFAKLLPFIFQAVKVAEVMTNEKSKGPEKKAAVKLGVNAVFDGWKEASTGGQKETAEKAEPLFEALTDKGIDLAASMLFNDK